MTFLFRHWNNVRRTLGQPDNVLWLFDFDGTLAPLAMHPGKAIMNPRMRTLLKKLHRRFPKHVGILSGRSLDQVRRKVGLPGLLYGGVHGFEIQGPGLHWKRRVAPSTQKKIRTFIRFLHRARKDIPGLWIEDKKWTFCVHFRQTRHSDQDRVRSFLRYVCNHARELGFKVQEGLKTIEVFSDARWNKGEAALWLRRRSRVKGVFYVGDDMTDETVFRVLGRSDVSVRIGRHETSGASYYLKKQSETRELLERILTL